MLKFEDLLKVQNDNLIKILSRVEDNSVFIDEDVRLLYKREIENYKEIFCCELDGIIPLIDISDNDYIVYIYESDTFGLYNIIDDMIFDENYDISSIIEKLEEI